MIEPGTIIDGRYEVLQRVGSGGMADVYLASDQLLGRKVAVKVLHHRFAEDQEFVERFRREASSAAGLSHPNVVSVFDRGEWDGTYYIAMEYLPGRTLKALVREHGALEPAAAIDVVVQVLRAVRFAHRRGVIHRDLKPHNVILDEEGRAKVTDFGIARAGASDMTLTGSIMGTAQYLSPEQAQGHAVSESSDLYAIGVVLYELLTGKVPFEGETAVTIALQHISREPPPPSALNPAVPAALDAIVLRALRKDPAQRYQSAEELIAALEQVRATLPQPRDEHALWGASAAAGLAGAALVQPGLGALRASQPPGATGSWRPTAGQLAAYGPATGIQAAAAAGGAGVQNGGGAEDKDGEARRRRVLIWVSVALAALAAVVVLVLLLSPKQVTLPQLSGLTKNVALARLRGLGLRGEPSYAANASVPSGQVVSQRPPAGSEVKPHTSVVIVVSTGVGSTTVPRLTGVSEEKARERLLAVGLRPEVRPRHSEEVASGVVISTDPASGRPVAKGTSVVVYVSSGPAQVKVPGVLGESRASAEERLEEAGLSIGSIVERHREGATDGTVIEQTPHAGQRVAKGTSVALVIAKPKSSASEQVVVPSVIEDGRESALATLRAAGLKPEVLSEPVSSSALVGFVVKQEPPAGTHVRKDSAVKVFVGAESTSTTTTSTTASTTTSSASTTSTTTKAPAAG
jgi:beta-lactam-binding protein with PASTA domain